MTGIDPRDRDLIIRTVIGEAAQEPFEGQAGVAHVIRNRLSTGQYGQSVPDVLFAPKQFEPWSTRSRELMGIDPQSPIYQRTGQVVDMVFGGQLPDPTGGALNFANVDIVRDRGNASGMRWINDMQANGSAVKIGAHTFGTPGARPGASAARAASRFELLDDPTPSPAPQASQASAAPAPQIAAEGYELLDDEPAKAAPPPADGGFDAGRFQDPQMQAMPGKLPDQVERSIRGAPSRAGSLARGIVQGATLNFGDEIGSAIGAGVDYLKGDAPDGIGQRYNERLQATRQEMDTAAAMDPGTFIAGQVAGGIATAPLLPAARAGVAGGALTGAAYGAIAGAGAGEGTQDRLQGAGTGALVGGVLGGALGGIAGRGGSTPSAPPQSQAVAEAADRIGVAVPKAVATDSAIVQRAGQGVRNIPFAGEPIIKATDNMIEGLGRAADNVAGAMGAGDRVASGEAAATAIRNWIGPVSQAKVTRLYDAVDDAINPAVRAPLERTTQTVSEILARNQNARIAGSSKAVDQVIEAVTAPGGLNYAGVKDLRTRIGEMVNTGILPEGMSGRELKQIYGALSDDLRNVVEASGGKRAVALFERANRVAGAVAGRREELARIVGVNRDAPAEQVFDRLARYASSKAGGDAQLLAKARNAIGEDWDEVVSGIVARIGRDDAGNFTPERFVTGYSRISDAAKNIMFRDPAHRRALDDIFTISDKAKDVYRKFGNPSGTAQNLSFGVAGVSAYASPLTALSVIGGGNMLSRVLASPATASSAAKWARAYDVAVTKPAAGTVAALQSATRNFSATIGENLGIRIAPQEIMRALSGPRVAPASDGENDQENQRQND